MSGPLAALSPVSMVANLAGGKGLLGKKKKSSNSPVTNNYYGGAAPNTTAGVTGPAPSMGV